MNLGKKTLKEWASDDRPREKLLEKGIGYLSDAELVAILIGSGNKEETAVELARRILIDYKSNLKEFGKISVDELTKYKGIGVAKAISVVAALELGNRRNMSEVLDKFQITKPEDVYTYMHPLIGNLPHEEFWVIYLNTANKIIKRSKIGQGGINKTSVDIRLIMKNAINVYSTSMIICHNHPTNSVSPSNADKQLTSKVKSAGELLGISLLDHIIIGSSKYYSFSDNFIL